MPLSISHCAFFRVRLKPVTEWPFERRRSTMFPPITPRPMKPTFAILRLLPRKIDELRKPVFSNRLLARCLTVLSHLPEMSAHRLVRGICVAPLNRVKNSLVINLSPLGTARNFEDAQPLLAQQADDGIEQREDKRVVGSLGKRQMKIEIGFNVGVRVSAGPVHDRYSFAHGSELGLLNARRGQSCNLGFQNCANLSEVSGAFGLPDFYHQVERLPNRLIRTIGDEGAAPGESFDQTLLPKSFDRLAHSRAADTEALRQFTLSGELIAGLQGAADDGLLDLLNDLLVQPRSAN